MEAYYDSLNRWVKCMQLLLFLCEINRLFEIFTRYDRNIIMGEFNFVCRHALVHTGPYSMYQTPHSLLNGKISFIANKIKTTDHLRYPYWNLLSIYGREFISFANKGWAMWLQVKKEEFQVKCQWRWLRKMTFLYFKSP